MLTSETYTVDGAIEELDATLADLGDEADQLEPTTDQHEAVQGRINRLSYFRNGLEWARSEWGGDAEIELGALTAGEVALMHREAPDHAGEDEMQLWYVAAATEDAPYAGDGLAETFDGVAQTHPGFAAWAEATANGLSVFSGGPDEGNGDAGASTT